MSGARAPNMSPPSLPFWTSLVTLTLACSDADSAAGPSTTGGDAAGGTAAGGNGGAGASASGAGGAGGVAGSGGTAGAGGGGGAADLDGDGIGDGIEASLAASYFPYFSTADGDGCPRHGVLYRLTPHPEDATKLAIWYDVLYEEDCGANGHVGDNEVFGAVIDPSLPPPAGILALRAISHQGTLCEQTTTCGSLSGCEPCTTAEKEGSNFPVVFASLNKHGGYVKESTCDLSVICDFGGCSLSASPDAPVLVNAGEPGAPLVTDLTADGFINAQNGWTEPSLMGFDPWGAADFGSAGNVADDLQDAAFVIAPGGC